MLAAVFPPQEDLSSCTWELLCTVHQHELWTWTYRWASLDPNMAVQVSIFFVPPQSFEAGWTLRGIRTADSSVKCPRLLHSTSALTPPLLLGNVITTNPLPQTPTAAAAHQVQGESAIWKRASPQMITHRTYIHTHTRTHTLMHDRLSTMTGFLAQIRTWMISWRGWQRLGHRCPDFLLSSSLPLSFWTAPCYAMSCAVVRAKQKTTSTFPAQTGAE